LAGSGVVVAQLGTAAVTVVRARTVGVLAGSGVADADLIAAAVIVVRARTVGVLAGSGVAVADLTAAAVTVAVAGAVRLLADARIRVTDIMSRAVAVIGTFRAFAEAIAVRQMAGNRAVAHGDGSRVAGTARRTVADCGVLVIPTISAVR
jgi:hypothetical protein